MGLRDKMLRFAWQSRGVLYEFGGDDLSRGVDCSGFVRCVLQQFGIEQNIELLPPGDYSAQMLYDHYRAAVTQAMQPGNLIFFGSAVGAKPRIVHVAFLIDDKLMLEAAGGSSSTREVRQAIARNACVKYSLISRRADRVAICNPFAHLNNSG